MNPSALVGIFVVGLLGGVHCLGMCGGIASALAASQPGARPVWPLQLAFNGGRIATYALAGAVAGLAGSLSLFLNRVLPVQLAMYVLANLMLIGLGLYLFGITRAITALEKVGAHFWRLLRPALRHVMPANTLPRALALGALWGWVPCGLVYSVLATALLAGDAGRGAAVMLAFGLGTLPNLLFAGALMRALARWRGGNVVRRVAGALVLAMGLFGLAQATLAGDHAMAGIFCLSPEH
jgi:sulfite exporter TauE/SafE